jgi:dihydroorotase
MCFGVNLRIYSQSNGCRFFDFGGNLLDDGISRMTDRPAKIFKLPGGKLSVGASADIAIFDPAMEWTYQKENIISKSSNSPFVGRKFKGKMLATVVAGNMAYQNT